MERSGSAAPIATPPTLDAGCDEVNYWAGRIHVFLEFKTTYEVMGCRTH
jgi:hypothetical protein